MSLKSIVILLIVVNILWDAFMEILDRRSLKNSIPVCVRDVYDENEYKKWRSYKAETGRVNVLGTAVAYAVELAMILFNWYAAFAKLFPQNLYAQLFSVVLLQAVVSTVFQLPFSVYSTFVIEAKYDFNRTTKKTFIVDEVKELLLGIIIEGALISLFAAVHQSAGNWFIPVFAGACVCLTLLITMISPALSRIFNKFRPLEDGELKEHLTQLLTSHGYRVRAVEVMDASRRSTKMNAYFTGIGPTKRIVLYDTMLEAMPEEQICAVFAHEMGHGIHHDIIARQLFSVINLLVIACAAWLAVSRPEAYADFGFDGINYGFAFLVLECYVSILNPLLNWLSSRFSRRAEYRADATAAEEGYGPALVAALKLLGKKNMADLSPDALLVKLTYSHPTLAQRIEAIEQRTPSAK